MKPTFDPAIIINVLKFLRADNFRVFLVSNKPLRKPEWENRFKTPYLVQSFEKRWLSSLENLQSDAKLPEIACTNLFHVDSLKRISVASNNIIPSDNAVGGGPELIFQEEAKNVKLWHRLDKRSGEDRACFNILIRTQIGMESDRSYIATVVFFRMLSFKLANILEDAMVAGINFANTFENNGISLLFTGPNSDFIWLIKEVIGYISQFEANNKVFNVIDEPYVFKGCTVDANGVDLNLRDCCNLKRLLTGSSNIDDASCLFKSNTLSIKDMVRVAHSLIHNDGIEALAYGNITSDDAVWYFNNVKLPLEDAALYQTLEEEENIMKNIPPSQKEIDIVMLPATAAYYYMATPISETLSAVDMYLQTGASSNAQHRSMEFVFTMVFICTGSPIIPQPLYFGGSMGIIFRAESSCIDVAELEENIEREILKAYQSLCNMDENLFSDINNSMANNLLEPSKTIEEESGILWNCIASEDADFVNRTNAIKALRDLCKKDLLKFIEEYLLKGGKERRKLVIHRWAKGSRNQRRSYYKAKTSKEIQVKNGIELKNYVKKHYPQYNNVDK